MFQGLDAIAQGVKLTQGGGVFFPFGILIDGEDTTVLTGFKQ